MNDNFDIKKIAQDYAYSRFPLASKKENEKLINDWINKIDTARKIVEDFKLRIADPKGLKILDAGSGNGGMVIAFTKAGADVIGLEISNELIDIAEKFANANNVNPEFILYDGEKMPFNDNTFDAILSISVLEHVTDPNLYLSEILRVLKPGGYLYLSFPNRLWPKETHTLLWFIHWLPYKFAERITKFLKRNPLIANNLHFYTYYKFYKIIIDIKKNGYIFNIKQEKGKSKNFIKNIIKKILWRFGISYKYFLPHIQLIFLKIKDAK